MQGEEGACLKGAGHAGRAASGGAQSATAFARFVRGLVCMCDCVRACVRMSAEATGGVRLGRACEHPGLGRSKLGKGQSRGTGAADNGAAVNPGQITPSAQLKVALSCSAVSFSPLLP